MDFHNELYDKLYDQESGQLNSPKIIELLRRLPEMFEKGDLFEVENICSEIEYAIRLSNTRIYVRSFYFEAKDGELNA